MPEAYKMHVRREHGMCIIIEVPTVLTVDFTNNDYLTLLMDNRTTFYDHTTVLNRCAITLIQSHQHQ